jgi:hypothetical protein
MAALRWEPNKLSLIPAFALGTPSIQTVHECYYFALEDRGRLALMAVELVADHLEIWLAVRRAPSLGAANSRSLRCESNTRMKELVRRSIYVPFLRFLGDVRREFIERLSFFMSSCGSSWHAMFLTS